MKLEEGMYVRTKDGIIAKCEEIIEDLDISFDREVYDFGNSIDVVEIPWHCKDEYILKTSYNIIDLIEVGDYVNGLKITLINEPSMANCYKRIVYAEDEKGYLIKSFNENEIKSIVTKEQFESMSYKVGVKE